MPPMGMPQTGTPPMGMPGMPPMPGMPGMNPGGMTPQGGMPGPGQIMDPEQYEQFDQQWTEMMSRMGGQQPAEAENQQ